MMDPMTLRQLLLVMHLAGLVLMAGTTVTDFIVFRTFKSLYKSKGVASEGLLQLMSGLGVILLVGGILLVLSGIGLMSITGGVYLHQLWFKLKLLLILLLPINGMLVGSPQMKKLRNLLYDPVMETALTIAKPIMTKLNMYHTFQSMVFLAIIVLAIFKVN